MYVLSYVHVRSVYEHIRLRARVHAIIRCFLISLLHPFFQGRLRLYPAALVRNPATGESDSGGSFAAGEFFCVFHERGQIV